MEFQNETVIIDKELSELDKDVIAFKKILEKQDLKYVFISGYVAILLGRSRGSEDIDLIVDMDKNQFEDLWARLESENYWCLNADKKEAWEMLTDDLSIRFAEKGTAIPNFEVALPQDEYDYSALTNSLNAVLNEHKIKISPLELQIAYKLYLGSEKDFEDALHIYTVAKESLSSARLNDYVRNMEVEKEIGELELEAEEREE